MFLLWGARLIGKSYIRGLFRYNRKNVVQMQIGGRYKSHKWAYWGKNQHRITYYRNKDESHISKEVFIEEMTTYDIISNFEDKGIQSREGVVDDYIGYGKNNKRPRRKIDVWEETGRELYPIYEDDGSVWEDHFFNDLCTCDLLIPQPHPQLFAHEPFLYFFRTSDNVLPYKSDILDMTIAQVNMFDPVETNKYWNVNVSNVEEAYNTNKELVFTHLDDFVRENRNVQQMMIDNKIPFRYFDLATDDHTFFDENLSNVDWGEWYANNNITHDKNSERYKIATNIAKDYIHTRGLTEVRLSGRVNDRI